VSRPLSVRRMGPPFVVSVRTLPATGGHRPVGRGRDRAGGGPGT
jgi:hypothetical protein